MKMLLARSALLAAAATVMTGLVLPASSAQARPRAVPAGPGFLCPRITAVCAFTAPNGHGERRLIFTPQSRIHPPLRSAVNQTPGPWCFYAEPGFSGDRREVSAGETVNDFGFGSRSVRPGRCKWA
jgi:hypothetical protein